MILERVEKDGLVRAIYESSNIIASTYSKNAKNLNIIFKNGGNYTYSNVSETDYMRFETAESQGNILNSVIKHYDYVKLENVDTNEIISKVKELVLEETKAMEVGLVSLMKDITSHFETTNYMDENLISRLNKMLNIYNNMVKR